MTVADLRARVLERLDEQPGNPYYLAPEILSALNEGERFFQLLTLALSATKDFPVTANTTFFRIRSVFPDWLLPRRVELPDGTRVRTATLAELDSLDSGWQSRPGTPKRYVAMGFDFFAIYPQPAAPLTLKVTYARAPKGMLADSDAPEIPVSSHFSLADYGVYVCRQKEGGQEFGKSLSCFDDFLDEALRVQQFMKARNLDDRYDTKPFDLANYDRSKLLAFRTQLAPAGDRKQ